MTADPFSTAAAATIDKARAVVDRMMSNVTIDCAGCWVYGNLRPNGYGRINLRLGELDGVTRQNRARSTHRLMYELMVGPIADGLHIDHLCRNRACCNPAHLEPVTSRENLLRSPLLGAATHCKRGHEFTPENTSWAPYYKYPRRLCRACTEMRLAERKAAPGWREWKRETDRRQYLKKRAAS